MTAIYHQFGSYDVEFSPLPLLKRLWLAAVQGKDFQIRFDPAEFPNGLPAELVYKVTRTARRLWEDHRLDLGLARVKMIPEIETQNNTITTSGETL